MNKSNFEFRKVQLKVICIICVKFISAASSEAVSVRMKQRVTVEIKFQSNLYDSRY